MTNICDDCVFHLFNLIYLLVHADIYQRVPYDGTLCKQNWRYRPLSVYVLGVIRQARTKLIYDLPKQIAFNTTE